MNSAPPQTNPADSRSVDPAALPELNNAVLSKTELEQLFADIRACAEVIEVIPKFAADAYVPETDLDLDAAQQLLEQRAVRALQIRYQYEGAQWWDTLMVLPQGIRLVRIRHDFA